SRRSAQASSRAPPQAQYCGSPRAKVVLPSSSTDLSVQGASQAHEGVFFHASTPISWPQEDADLQDIPTHSTRVGAGLRDLDLDAAPGAHPLKQTAPSRELTDDGSQPIHIGMNAYAIAKREDAPNGRDARLFAPKFHVVRSDDHPDVGAQRER